uniref:F-box domain-containing protein n=2 Tax=Auxenochlorella protothecoides TaxID=3075 RepID=A0A1D2A033_AUXPR
MVRGGAQSRGAAAFESLLATEEVTPSTRRSKTSTSKSSKGNLTSGSNPVPGFRLRAEAAKSDGEAKVLADLCQAFAGVFPRDTVADVLHASAGDPDRAAASLLALSGHEVRASDELACGRRDTGLPSPTANAPDLEPISTSDLWSLLPGDLKKMILRQLSVRDLARAARVNREFACVSRNLSSQESRLVLPRGLSPAAVTGAVTAFHHATSVNLSQWHADFTRPEALARIIQAIATGEGARASGTPVQELVLRKCATLGGDSVALICRGLPHLTSLDLRRCTGLGDAAVLALARYRRREAAASAGEAPAEAAHGLLGAVVGPEPGTATSAPHGAGPPLRTEPGPSSWRLGDPLLAPADALAQILAARVERGQEAGTAASGAGALASLALSDVDARALRALWSATAPTAQGLVSLSLHGARRLDLQPLLNKAVRSGLRHLHVSDCPRTERLALELPKNLESLSLTGLREVTSINFSAARLLRLTLGECPKLGSLSLTAPTLRTLRVATGCGSQGEVALRLPRLADFSACGWRMLSQSVLEALLRGSPALQSLGLSGCQGVRTLAIPAGSPCLQSLELERCSGLEAVHVAAAAPLTRLSLVGCKALKEVVAPRDRLTFVRLVDCGELAAVRLIQSAESDGDRAQLANKAEDTPLRVRGCPLLGSTSRAALKAAVLGPAGG